MTDGLEATILGGRIGNQPDQVAERLWPDSARMPLDDVAVGDARSTRG